jgi:hypothetical protein
MKKWKEIKENCEGTEQTLKTSFRISPKAGN